MNSEESDLLARLKSNTSRDAAFSELLALYREPIYRHIRRMSQSHESADDLLQETFIKVWRYLDSFRGESSLSTWIYKIATNETLGKIRKDKNRASVSFEEHHAKAGSSEADAPEVIVQKLGAALDTLPEKQRLVFNLRYYSEMPYEEISKITGTSVGALKASYFHAAKKIEAHLTR